MFDTAMILLSFDTDYFGWKHHLGLIQIHSFMRSQQGTWTRGVTFAKIVHGCACRTSKIGLTLYQYFAQIPIHQYFQLESTQFCPNRVLFSIICSTIFKFGHLFLSLMKTHWLLYQILWKGTSKGRHTYTYLGIPCQYENPLGHGQDSSCSASLAYPTWPHCDVDIGQNGQLPLLARIDLVDCVHGAEWVHWRKRALPNQHCVHLLLHLRSSRWLCAWSAEGLWKGL